MSTISISDKGAGAAALYAELLEIEKMQLDIGEQMAQLILKQVQLADKSRALALAMEKTFHVS